VCFRSEKLSNSEKRAAVNNSTSKLNFNENLPCGLAPDTLSFDKFNNFNRLVLWLTHMGLAQGLL